MNLPSKMISIEQATQKDMSEVAKLSMELLKHENELTGNYFTVYSHEYYVKKFEQKLNDGQCILVAKINNNVVGFLMAEFLKTPWYRNNDVCMIDEVSVSEKHRSCGIGTALFKKVLSICKDKNIEEVKLNVYNANVGAKNLYERLGFRDLRQQMSLVLKRNSLERDS